MASDIKQIGSRVLLAVLLIFCSVILFFAAGCAGNSMFGHQDLQPISQESEIRLGNKQYFPAQQAQGGEFQLYRGIGRYVSEVGGRMAQASSRPDLPYEFVVLNDSLPDAWALPGGKIAVSRGLLVELENEAELAAVLAHEILHSAARHGLKELGSGIVSADSSPNDFSGGPDVVYNRAEEQEADYFALISMAEAGYDPQAAVSLQTKFFRLSRQKKSIWRAGLFISHPPSKARLKYATAISKNLADRGVIGHERYRNVMAPLLKTRRAYAAYEEGRKVLEKGDLKRAMLLADQAISIEPDEALFHSLHGEILWRQKKHRQALSAYGRAINLNSSYYRFFLERGIVAQEMGLEAAAQRDLAQSIKLLPTAKGHYALGQGLLNKGQRAKALGHFRKAATGDSQPGKKAVTMLAALELSEKPQKYLATQVVSGHGGQAYIQIRSRAPFQVSGLILQLQAITSSGRIYSGEVINLPGPIAPFGTYNIPVQIERHENEHYPLEIRTKILSVHGPGGI